MIFTGCIKTLIDSGYVTENFLQTTYDQQLRAFADGRAAMMVMGSWRVSMIRSMTAGCNFGLFILPASSDGVNWIPSSVGGMLASASVPPALWLMQQDKAAMLFAMLAVMIVLKHRENIARLRAGTESKIGARKDK